MDGTLVKQQQQWFDIDYWSRWLKIDLASVAVTLVFLFVFWIWESTRWAVDPIFVSVSFIVMSLILLAALLPWEYWNFLHSVRAVGCDDDSIHFKWQSRPLFPGPIKFTDIASIQVASGTRGLLTIKLKDGGEALAFPLGFDSEATKAVLESWQTMLEKSGDSLTIEESRGLGLRAYLAHPSSAKAKWSV
jgi:hypothetical protein